MSAYRENARNSLAKLDASEARIFADLVRLLVRSDDELSAAERQEIDRIAEEVGREIFWQRMDEAASAEQSADQILARAKGVGTKDTHELMYGALYELSTSDGMSSMENDLLDRLATTWNLAIEDVLES